MSMMQQLLYLALAAILLAARLPSFMTRLGMSTADKVAFVLIIFAVLGLAGLAVWTLGMIV